MCPVFSIIIKGPLLFSSYISKVARKSNMGLFLSPERSPVNQTLWVKFLFPLKLFGAEQKERVTFLKFISQFWKCSLIATKTYFTTLFWKNNPVGQKGIQFNRFKNYKITFFHKKILRKYPKNKSGVSQVSNA